MSQTWDVILEETSIAVGSWTSPPFRLYPDRPYCGLHYTVSGAGTVAIQALVSIDKRNYISDTEIATGLVATSGPSGDGKGILNFTVSPADFVKIKVTVTVGSATVGLWLTQRKGFGLGSSIAWANLTADQKREYALTVNSAYDSNSLLEYRGYHEDFEAANGDTGWLIDKFAYSTGLELKRVTYYAATATWTGRAGYFS